MPREEPEISEEVPPVAKSRISIVVILSMLLGILLTVALAGTYFHIQQSKALQNEVLVVKAALNEKNMALEEMKTQIEALSRQMYLLKEYSVARSSLVSEKKPENVTPSAVANAPKTSGGHENTESPAAPAPVPAPVKVKKPKPDTPNCELVGKSAEEQAATLRRCVSLMDSPGDKPRSR